MGGLAIKSALPIKSKYATEISKKIVKSLNDELNINSSTAGSTGKKPDDTTSGDIDILVELEWNENNVNKLYSFIKKHLGNNIETHILTGLKIFSIGYPYIVNNEQKIAQVDFMFTNDLEYSKFMYHSPNYRKNESEFKGLFRTNLLAIITSKTPINQNKYPTTYFDEEHTIIKDMWKYSLNYTEGLKIVHKTYLGKRGNPIKNPTTIKDDTIFVTKDISNILYIILGSKATIKTCNSFETLVDFLCSPEYRYRSTKQLDLIFEDFFNDARHIKYPDILENIKQYIDKIRKKYNI